MSSPNEFTFATQQTVHSIMETVNIRVGSLDPYPNGSRGDEFLGKTPYGNKIWLSISQTPLELSKDGSTAFINIAPACNGGPRGPHTHYRLFPEENGSLDIVESHPDNINISNIRSGEAPKNYFDRVEEERRKIYAEERAAGLGSVTEKDAFDLIWTMKRAKSKRHPKGFAWLKAYITADPNLNS